MSKCYPENIELFSYEELYTSTARTFEDMLTFLGISTTSSEMQEKISMAVNESSQNNIRKIEQEKGSSLANDQIDPNASHIKDGKIGKWEEHFDDKSYKSVVNRLQEFDIDADHFILKAPNVKG